MEKDKLKIERREVLRYLGHRGQAIDTETERMIGECITDMLATVRPRYIYRIFDIAPRDEGIALLSTDIILRGESIRKHFADCEKCAVTAATLGVEADNLISRSERADMTRAVILDACATDCVEKVCDEVENEIKSLACAEGFGTKFRFSAGYGDLPIEHQSEIIAALGAAKQIGLTVTENNILIPRKSVTALIGFSRSCANEKKSGCDICSKRENCKFRR